VDSKLEVFYEKGLRALSRRNFLAGASAVGAASALAGCSNNSSPSTVTVTPTTPTYTDTDILNFALNLEYLEAQYYLRAATGLGLIAADTGMSGTVNGGAKVPTTSTFQQNVINEIAFDEQQHVRFLRTALGSSAVGMPTIDLTDGFSGAVTAANSITSTLPAIPTTFNPFSSFDAFIVGAFVFEDVGVTAYNGAGPLISAAGVTSGYLTAAAGIMAVEAYHAGYVRTYLSAQSIAQGTTAYPYAQYANRISLLRSALGGANETPLVTSLTSATVPVTPTSPTVSPSGIVAANSNSIAYARTTDQVMHIVYGTYSPAGGTTLAKGVSKGGFFPNGLMGNINTTLS
jgi:hypothetical protein